MLSLHTNNAALSAQSAINRTQSNLTTSMTRLSTGYRINSAMDDAAGLQIATRLKSQGSGMAVAMRNTQNAISMMQTGEGALAETSNILVRMKDLATQSADASATPADKTAMQSEYDALARELSNIVGNTSFGGEKLLMKKASTTDVTNAASALATANTAYGDATSGAFKAQADAATAHTAAKSAYDAAGGQTAANATTLANAAKALTDANTALDKATLDKTAATAFNTAALASAGSATDGKFTASLNFQIGSSTAETMSLNMSSDLTSLHTALGATSKNYNSFGAALNVTGTELTSAGGASAAIDKLQTAIDAVGAVRSSLGAASNRLDHVATNLANVSSNTAAAAGRIMDVDFASESASMTSSQMLLQAGTAMLKQSNSMSSMVMSLLQ